MSNHPTKHPLIIRGHTLLCLQGFRGEGYSPAFVENMEAIHRRLSNDPDTAVQVVAQTDLICAACPHRHSDGCRLKGPGFEESMKLQDREVIGRLGMTEGEIRPWREILQRVAIRISGRDLDAICGACRWLPLGYCKEGVDALKVLQHSVRSS